MSSISTLLFNLNPLLRLDGYYIFSDWLEIPNLREKADKALENACLKLGLGIDVDPIPLPGKTRSLFIAYAICSALYRSFLLVVICCLLYSALKPYRLEFLGLMVGVLSAGLGTTSWIRRIRSAAIKCRSQYPANTNLRGYSLILLATGFAAAFFFVPIPISLKAPLRIEYANAQRVFSGTDGRLAAIHVRPGQSVRAGQVLFELSSFEDALQLQQLNTKKQVQEIERKKTQSIGRPKANCYL